MSELTERDQFWLSHLQAAEGTPLSRYAAEHDLSVDVLYAARSRLKRKGALPGSKTSRFVPVIGARTQSAMQCRVLLRNGTVVEVSGELSDCAVVLDAASRLA